MKQLFFGLKAKAMAFMAMVMTMLMLVTTQAYAALPDGVETAIQTGFTDANKVAGMVLAGLAVIFGILLARRLLR